MAKSLAATNMRPATRGETPMNDVPKQVISTKELLKDSPKNWGKWGPDDEVGSLNYLTKAEVLRGVAAVKQGKTFTLQVPIGHPKGDPMAPGRSGAIKVNTIDKGHWA